MRWYDPKLGRKANLIELKTKPGQFREANVADARKLGLVPSVTTVIDTISKPMLYEWLQQQAFDYAWDSAATPISKEEAYELYKIDGNKVRDKGSELHDKMSRFEEDEITGPLISYLRKHYAQFMHEREFCTNQYGGTIDMLAWRDDGTRDIIDFKFCSKMRKPYQQELWQLAAYAMAQGINGKAINIIIDQNTGEFWCYPWSEEALMDGYDTFRAVLNTFQHINKVGM